MINFHASFHLKTAMTKTFLTIMESLKTSTSAINVQTISTSTLIPMNAKTFVLMKFQTVQDAHLMEQMFNAQNVDPIQLTIHQKENVSANQAS